MQCPRCHTDTTGFINFCSVCGYRLSKQQDFRRFLWRLAILMGTIFAAGFIIFNISKTFINKKSSTGSTRPFFQKSHLKTDSQKSKSGLRSSRFSNQEERVRLPHGKIILRDRKGNMLLEYPAVAVSGGWIALPVKLVYGAYEWDFISPNGIALPIIGGILQDHDQIGLWRIDETLQVNGPELVSWNPEIVMEWIALDSINKPVKIQPDVYSESGDFAQIKIPEHIQSNVGCFIQNNHIVGWTFGKVLKDGCLWMGHNGIDLKPDFRIDDFYRLTFSQSREEYFLMALSDKSISDAELFTLLIEAFFCETKMPVNAIPEALRIERITQILADTASRLLISEQYLDIADAIDINILLQIQSIDLAIAAIEAVSKTEGPEAAFQLMRQFYRLSPTSWFDTKSPLSELHRNLYLNRLRTIAETSSKTDTFILLQEARDLFPNDPGIHLAAVRMYLYDGHWQTAESLLLTRAYPESYNDTVETLTNRIDELKRLEGKTVIRFIPGSSRIQVNARLNEQVTQQFIIDTGASVTTIPPSAAKAIGVNINGLSSKQKIYSAGGEFTAPVISLESIAVDQLIVYDLNVLVVELSYNTNFGLLGMDFLSHFKMNLNTENGILILEPK